MKCSHQVLLLALLCLAFVLSAQDFDNYVPIRSSGKLPVEFRTSSTERYEEERNTISKRSGRKERQVQDKFYLESSFSIDQIFLSGKVLFNDPIGSYINKVADEILKDDPQLRAKLRFYVVKSVSSNAFTTQRGAIFVTMGMVARIENEAQLAFILCHEIAHFKEGHVLKSYVHQSVIQEEQGKGKGRYKKANNLEQIIQQSEYSQENERKADAIGLELYLESSYSTAAVPSVFGPLIRDVDKPISPLFRGYTDIFSELVPAENWDKQIRVADSIIEIRNRPHKSMIENFGKKPHYILEGINLADDIDIIKNTGKKKKLTKPQETPKIASHPDANEREKLVTQNLPKNTSGSLFLVSEAEYATVINMARFELSELLIENTGYFDALYLTLNLLGEYPNSKYLKKELVKALYGFSQYRFEDQEKPSFFKYKSLPWPSRRFEYFLEDLSKVELYLIALTKVWDSFEEYPDDPYYRKVLLDLIFDLLDTDPDFIKIFEDEPTLNKTLDQLMENAEFQKMYDEAQKERKRVDEWDEFLGTFKGRRSKAAYFKKITRRGYKLGIDKLVVFNPGFYRLDIRKKGKNPIQYVAAEEQQSNIREYLLKAGNDLDLDLKVLDSRTDQSDQQTESFNDISLLETWQAEKMMHDEVDMVGSKYGEIQAMAEKYGTPYFVNMGVISVRARFPQNRYVPYALAWVPVLWPFLGYETFRHEEVSIVYSLVYDVQEGELIAAPYNAMQAKVKNVMLYNSLYYDLYQMKSKKQK